MAHINATDLNPLDEAIVRVHAHLKDNLEVGTDEYNKTLDQLKKLYEIRKSHMEEAEPPAPAPEPVVDKDRARLKDWIPVIGSIAGIAVIVIFEATGHAMTSKGVGFIPKR